MSRQSMISILLLVALLVTLFQVSGQSPADPEGKVSARIYEQRVYTCHPGKLEALHRRFRDHTNYLFVKHGMTLIGYWTPEDRKDTEEDESKTTLSYILAYPSREARERSWAGFKNDPAWKKAYAESHRDGPIVKNVLSTFMSPTDFSPLQ